MKKLKEAIQAGLFGIQINLGNYSSEDDIFNTLLETLQGEAQGLKSLCRLFIRPGNYRLSKKDKESLETIIQESNVKDFDLYGYFPFYS